MPMRAVVAGADAPGGLRLAEVAVPRPRPGQVLVEVHYASLNRSDLNARTGAGGADPYGDGEEGGSRTGAGGAGPVLGCDFAGEVVRTTKGGPEVGARVVGSAPGAFARRVVADLGALVEVPDGVSLAEAAALPTAGVAALQALRAGLLDTRLRGARVLVTGASGGVGRFAVQLAAAGGGYVIAVTGSPARKVELIDLGADEVLPDPSYVDEPVDLVLDPVGGPHLVAAWGMTAPGGNVQCIGSASGEPAAFPPGALVGPPKSLNAFRISAPVAPDLAHLVRMLEQRTLQVHIAWRGPMSRIAEAAEAMRGRRLAGKAVLDLTSGR